MMACRRTENIRNVSRAVIVEGMSTWKPVVQFKSIQVFGRILRNLPDDSTVVQPRTELALYGTFYIANELEGRGCDVRLNHMKENKKLTPRSLRVSCSNSSIRSRRRLLSC